MAVQLYLARAAGQTYTLLTELVQPRLIQVVVEAIQPTLARQAQPVPWSAGQTAA